MFLTAGLSALLPLIQTAAKVYFPPVGAIGRTAANDVDDLNAAISDTVI
jgi:hypothetical protein